MLVELLVLAFLIALSAFFSGAEVALVKVTQAKVRTLMKERRRGARALDKLKGHSRRMLITILVGNNVANITAASFATVVAAERLDSNVLGVVTGVLTFVVLLFGEIIPKTFASRSTVPVALFVARPLLILSYALWPLVRFFQWLADGMNALVKLRGSHGMSENDVRSFIELGVEKKVLEPEEQAIMNRAIRFSDTRASDAMTPMKNVFAQKSTQTVAESVDAILARGFSRIPIYDRDPTVFTGIVFLKELFVALREGEGEKPLAAFATEPIVVSSALGIDDVLKVFQYEQVHVGLVQDARKRILGIITLEDLLEELVGEITDESEVTPQTIVRLNRTTAMAHGGTTLRHLNRFLNLGLAEEEEGETLAHFLTRVSSRQEVDSTITHKGIRFTIEHIRGGAIMKVRIEKPGM